MVSVAGNSLRSLIRVYHKDASGVLHSLQTFELSEKVLDAIARGERRVYARSFPRGDLMKLAQMRLGATSEINLVVEFLWDAKSFITIVKTTDDAQLRRRVLEMALNRIRRTPILSKILAGKGCRPATIRENPYLKCGHPPYDNFIQSLLSFTDGGRGEFFELFLESAGDEADVTAFTSVERRGVRTVFHGTNHAGMDNILNIGLDPSYRRDDLRDDYFGLDYNTSLHYTRSKTGLLPAHSSGWKLLVFMIIVTGSRYPYVSFNSCGAVTAASNMFQLPLAEITL